MHISEKREQLHSLSNELVDSYNKIIETTNNQSSIDKDIINKLTEQIKIQKKEIDDKDKLISSQNKKCYDYETVINNYQEQMVSIEEEKKTNNRVSIVISQANELENKDRYIEQLENKIKIIKSKNIGISESPLSRNNKNVFEKELELIASKEGDCGANVTSVDGDDAVGDDVGDDAVGDDVAGDDVAGDDVAIVDKPTKLIIEDVRNITEPYTSSEEEEEVTYKRITYKKVKYYIIVDQMPQIVYRIDDNGDPGDPIGIREKKNSKYIVNFN